ncbi:MAG: DUF6676 family protein [Actinomycetota bacterium]|nr:DUF6676 family protein [Actinomycetota bacterium]
MNWIRRTGLLTVLLVLVVVGSASGALAADLETVVDEVASTGVYLDRGVSISENDATQIVSAARNNGSRFYLVVLDDTPLGGNSAFAEAVFEGLDIDGGTVLVMSPEDIGWVTDNDGFTEDDMLAAFDFANSEGGNDAEYAANFVVALVGGTTPADTAPVTTVATAESSDGGGGGFLIFIVIIGGLGLLVFWLMRRGSKQTVNAAAQQMAKARTAVQKQVDAVANDILDLEDEVRVADNREADQFYNEAGETYRTVTEQLPNVETPQQLIELSNDLDVAIWQLDSAEALLDGKPKPPRPEPKRLEPVAPPSQDRVTAPAPRPDYQRRPSRRSSYLGPGMMEILFGVAGQVLGGGGGSTRRGRIGSSGRRSSTPTPRAGRGGGVVPGPGAPVARRSTRRSATRRSPSRSTRRRSGGRRIRGGGRRRK